MNESPHCREIGAALESLSPCVETDRGACFTTHCLYPSFDPVVVYVVRYGDGYEIHDGGGAVRSAWDHGRDLNAARRLVSQHGQAHALIIKNDSIVAKVDGRDWLLSAILTVANVSSAAAYAAVESAPHVVENILREMIYTAASEVVPKTKISKEYELRGRSGKIHRFDYAVHPEPALTILMDAVSPHHISIASKYMAFSDTSDFVAVVGRFAIHDKPLAPDDFSLLQQVADIVPLVSLAENLKKHQARWK